MKGKKKKKKGRTLAKIVKSVVPVDKMIYEAKKATIMTASSGFKRYHIPEIFDIEDEANYSREKERRLMAVEDARSMEVENRSRAKSILPDIRKMNMEQEKEEEEVRKFQESLLRDEGFMSRFGYDVRFDCWRTTPEYFSTLEGHLAPVLSIFSFEPSEHKWSKLSQGENSMHEDSSPPHASLIISSSSDGSVRVWDWENSKCISVRYIDAQNAVPCIRNDIRDISQDDDPTELSNHVPTETGSIAPTTHIYFGCLDGRLFEANRCFDEHHEDVVYNVCLSPDHSELATCSADGTIKRWFVGSPNEMPNSVKTNKNSAGQRNDMQPKLLYTYEGHTGAVTYCKYSPDGKYILSCGDRNDPTIRLWDAEATHNQAVESIENESLEFDVECFDCNYILKERFHKEQLLKTEQEQVKVLGLDKDIPEGKNEENNNEDEEKKRLLDLNDERKLEQKRFSNTYGGKIRVFHVHGKGLKQKQSHSDWINQLDISEDSKILLSCSSDLTARVWRISDGVLLTTIVCSDWIMGCKFFPKRVGNIYSNDEFEYEDEEQQPQRHFAACLANSNIEIWDYLNGTKQQLLCGHRDVVYRCVFNVSKLFGAMLHSCSHDGTIKTWKLEGGKPLKMDPPEIIDVGKDFINMKWKMPVENGGRVTQFRILVRENGKKGFVMLPGKKSIYRIPPEYKFTNFNHRITGLRPGSSYEFKIAAMNHQGYGEDSDPSDERRCQASLPMRPQAPVIDRTTVNTAMITWISPDSMGSHIQYFVVRYRGGVIRSFEDSPQLDIPWESAKTLAEEEEQKRKQRMRKLAERSGNTIVIGTYGNKKQRGEHRFSTTEIDQQDVDVQRKHDLMRLGIIHSKNPELVLSNENQSETKNNTQNETDSSGQNSFGKKYLRTAGKNHFKNKQAALIKANDEYNFLSMSCLIEGLEPGMSYQFSVAAVNKLGRSDFSAASCSEVTKSCEPGKPSVPKRTRSSITSISLRWLSAKSNGDIVLGYTVRYAEQAVMNQLIKMQDDEAMLRARIQNAIKRGAPLRKDIITVADDISKDDIVSFKDLLLKKVPESCLSILFATLLILDASLRELQEDLTPGDKLAMIKAKMRHVNGFREMLKSGRDHQLDENEVCEQEKMEPPFSEKLVEYLEIAGCLDEKEILLDQPPACVLNLTMVLKKWILKHIKFSQLYYSQVWPHLKKLEGIRNERNTIEEEMLKKSLTVHKKNDLEVTNLKSGTAYRFQVRAFNACGCGEFSEASDAILTDIGPPSEVTNVKVVECTPSSAKVTWMAPKKTNGKAISKYHIFQQLDLVGQFRHCGTVDGQVTSFLSSSLPPKTAVKYFITAENMVGQSEKSECCQTARTLEAQVPQKVGFLVASDVSPNSIKLEFSIPEYDGGEEITNYVIYRNTKLPLDESNDQPEEVNRSTDDHRCSCPEKRSNSQITDAVKGDAPCEYCQGFEKIDGTFESSPIEIKDIIPGATETFKLHAENVVGIGPPVELSVVIPTQREYVIERRKTKAMIKTTS